MPSMMIPELWYAKMTKSEYLKMTLKEIAPGLNFNLIDPLIDLITEEIESHVHDYIDAQAPTITPVRTGEEEDQVVTIVMATATPGATIHYTVNGDTPNPESPIYTEPILPEGELPITYNAIAVGRWFNDSLPATLDYPGLSWFR